jgi:hypothetical protein
MRIEAAQYRSRSAMPYADLPNYRQQRALDAIDRAAIDFDIAVRAHAPATEAVRQAQRTLMAVAEMVKVAIMTNGKDHPK